MNTLESDYKKDKAKVPISMLVSWIVLLSLEIKKSLLLKVLLIRHLTATAPLVTSGG